MWLFNSRFLIVALILVTAPVFSSELGFKGYVVSYSDDEKSERWANYLYNHLSNRAEDKTIVLLQKVSKEKSIKRGYKSLFIQVSSGLQFDYCIQNSAEQLDIRAQNDRSALWIIYQVIGNISIEDNRINAADFPPPMINLSNSCKNFDFEYREPHFAPNLQTDFAPILGTNNVETDWGIWGHNVSRIVNKYEDENLYALVEGKRVESQLCFSSPQFFEHIRYFIIDNYGRGDETSNYFMISPKDNNLVCTCSECSKLGNTSSNATPAVSKLVLRLSEHFPDHRFYMTAYRTTASPPTFKLPKNSGVFISTIKLPKGIKLNKKQSKTSQFLNQLNEWRSITDNIYLWDYAANYDDYLTPIPVLFGLQQHLQFFKNNGVKGVFINGSGYDYSSFDGMKTYVIAALMMDTQANVEELCRRYFVSEFPVSGNLLANYYLSLEQNYAEKNKAYNLYGGMRDNLKTYLDAAKFITFYEAVETLLPIIRGEEWNKLLKLYTALTFTRLQIAYTTTTGKWGYGIVNGNKLIVKPEISEYVNLLGRYVAYSDMANYDEIGNTLEEYTAEWNALIAKHSFQNALLGEKIEILSKPDEGFESVSLLNDGSPGFPQDYLQGWYLFSGDKLQLQFSTTNLQNTNTLRLRFLNNPRQGLLSPEKIEILADGKPLKMIASNKIKIVGNTASCDIDIDFSKMKNVVIKMTPKEAKKSIIACDEVQILKL